ncbi:MAG: response regulator [Melioribacteraceae bacterium]|nr:response regulator [Melioribacteraceae bacterium]
MKRILIVDDVKANQLLLQAYTVKLFEQIEFADNGLTAYEMCKQKEYDAIIMDIQMPVINGIDATELIRKKENSINQKTPIIGITASSQFNYEMQCLDRGMDAVLFKPISRKILVQEIEDLISGNYKKTENQSSYKEYENSSAPFNFEKALDEFAGEKKILIETLTRFVEDLEAQIFELGEEIKNENLITARKIAHKIRGASINLTAKPLADIAELIEESDDDTPNDILEHYHFLMKERKTDFVNTISTIL